MKKMTLEEIYNLINSDNSKRVPIFQVIEHKYINSFTYKINVSFANVAKVRVIDMSPFSLYFKVDTPQVYENGDNKLLKTIELYSDNTILLIGNPSDDHVGNSFFDYNDALSYLKQKLKDNFQMIDRGF